MCSYQFFVSIITIYFVQFGKTLGSLTPTCHIFRTIEKNPIWNDFFALRHVQIIQNIRSNIKKGYKCLRSQGDFLKSNYKNAETCYLHLIQIIKQCEPEIGKNKTSQRNISQLQAKFLRRNLMRIFLCGSPFWKVISSRVRLDTLFA